MQTVQTFEVFSCFFHSLPSCSMACNDEGPLFQKEEHVTPEFQRMNASKVKQKIKQPQCFQPGSPPKRNKSHSHSAAASLGNASLKQNGHLPRKRKQPRPMPRQGQKAQPSKSQSSKHSKSSASPPKSSDKDNEHKSDDSPPNQSPHARKETESFSEFFTNDTHSLAQISRFFFS